MKKYITGFIILLVAVFGLLALRPLPKASLKNCETHTGVVEEVLPGKGKSDIVIQIKQDDHYYYINRGMENGLLVADLKSKLTGKQVQLLTIKHWTPLDFVSSSKHIAQLSLNNEVVYSEM